MVNKLRRWGAWLAVFSALLVVLPSAAWARRAPSCTATHWVGSWMAAPSDATVSRPMSDQTIRMIIAPHLGGGRLRLHLSNRFGAAPIRLGPVTIGVRGRGAALVPSSRRVVRFSGASTVSIPAGRDVLSDPVKIRFHAFQELAISVTVSSTIAHPTEHYDTRQTNYLTPAGSGNHAANISGAAFTTTLASSGWYFLDGLDVIAPARTGAVVTFGDSITDGFQGNKSPLVEELSTINKNGRYPDDLQRRITRADVPLSVLNAGISGNRVLQGSPSIFGPSGLSRFRADALSKSGVTDVIVLEGINDIGQTPGITAAQLINGYKQLIHQAHAARIAIQLGTLTPSGGTINPSYGGAAANGLRNTVNHWIRTQRLSNGIIDFDAEVRDPGYPSRINPIYDGSDHLHFNLAGYRAMARAVNLKLLRTPRCAR